MSHTVVHHTPDPSEARAAAVSFLESRPVHHNLILSLLQERIAHPEPGDYWWHETAGTVDGFVFRSPGFMPATVAAIDVEVARELAESMAADVPDLAGITGEAAPAATFAGQWTETLATSATVHEGQRIYRLDGLLSPPPVEGELRTACPGDLETIVGWLDDFQEETGGSMPIVVQLIARRIEAGRARLWTVGGRPVALTMATPVVVGASRVGPVYTPPADRRRGYAGACVAMVSAQLLAEGATDCLLYTQLSNPSSNRIYRRLGYVAVGEVLAYRFGA